VHFIDSHRGEKKLERVLLSEIDEKKIKAYEKKIRKMNQTCNFLFARK